MTIRQKATHLKLDDPDFLLWVRQAYQVDLDSESDEEMRKFEQAVEASYQQ